VTNPPAPSYRQIVSSSVLIGGSSLFTILATMLRTKLVAVILGPAGMGLIGLFSSITTVAGTLTGMGIATSGARQIAEATGAGEELRVARTVTAMRWIVVRLGVLGSVLLAIFSVPVSRATFATADFAAQVALLSAVIAVGAIADGQTALLQGLRRIGDMSRVAILGTAVSTVLTVPVLYFWRQDAVVPLLLVTSGAGLFASWWYARRVSIPPVSMKWRDAWAEVKPLLRLGLAAMSAALMAAAIAYVVRVEVVTFLGLEAAGIFQAATAMSSVYCGFILTTMGADFLPRISSVGNDDAQCNRLVNEQAEVGLLLAFPGICATLTFAPLIVPILYSGQFGPAADVLRWQVLGVFLRVASWPLGYLLLAKGKARLYFWTEASYNVLYAGLIWICVRRWGLPGAGIAFFGLYIYYTCLMCVVTRKLSGFAWSAANRRFSTIAVPTVAFVFLCPTVFPAPWHVFAATAATALAGVYARRTLLSLPGCQHPFGPLAARIQHLRAAL
jgi:enterobacterial common antigen flippase